MPITTRPLFVYGTLRDPDVLSLVLGATPDPATVIAAEAPDCRTVYYPRRSYPALLPLIGATAPGLLLTALTAADLARLDGFEGPEYSRGPVEIIVSGARSSADVYWPVATISPEAENWSLAAWTARHKTAFMDTETQSAAELRQRLAVVLPDKW
jgi:hypothetical protein